ncbi:hypothetical protein ACHAW5_000083 [Stephanodiscus triporus]|uniref:Cation/H+ exchanger transmembrane domain-containing protein n=1 Tax=Stephanodiscus triporus TaxID=2934178 RepID=A0ABD3QVZ9_9STRA
MKSSEGGLEVPDSRGIRPREADPPERAARSDRRGIDVRLRDSLVRSNVDVVAVGIFSAWLRSLVVVLAESDRDDESARLGDGAAVDIVDVETFPEEERAVYAFLFPWFAQIAGVLVYYLLSRHAHGIPYTAIMFIVGALIGVITDFGSIDALAYSAKTWAGIDGEVILLTFLPGLIFHDSYSIDVHLFVKTFWQVIIFAFPMMLVGTYLTAFFATAILPYGWSWDLCMTFGSILGATDPVAVSVLMNELGAPPRLKMHIQGESIMNDGSAAVFYQIFSARFLYETGIQGLGEDSGLVEGFEKFIRLAIGGTCVGIAFGGGLLTILFLLNRRLSGEDSTVQVVATITTSYLAFFVSEVLLKCSGIIAVFACAVTVKAFGETLYNNSELSHHFWSISEYLLNTLLFTLAGLVWGSFLFARVSDGAGDLMYILVLFIFINAIRFLLVFGCYPLTAKIGIGTNWQEAVFMSYGGLRGGVGIALSLSLHAGILDRLESANDDEVSVLNEYKKSTGRVFFLVGSVAFLTLVTNGPTCGLLLHWLGLVTPTECRKKVVEHYKRRMVMHTLKEYVALLTERAFQDVDLRVVVKHIPFLKDTTYEEFMAAVEIHKENSSSHSYTPPNLKNVTPYFNQSFGISAEQRTYDDVVDDDDDVQPEQMKHRRLSAMAIRQVRRRSSVYDAVRADTMGSLEERVLEERVIFISVLRSAYHRLVKRGELEGRGFIAHSLFQSLNLAEDAASKCLPLDDWNALEESSQSWAMPAESLMRRLFNRKNVDFDSDFFVVSLKVRQIIAFNIAHDWAKKTFKREFSECGEGRLTEAEKVVLDESDEQVRLAEEALSKLDARDVKLVTGRYACQILLNRAAYYLTELEEEGFMSGREAGEFLDEIHEHISDLYESHENGRVRGNLVSEFLKSFRNSVGMGNSIFGRRTGYEELSALADLEEEELEDEE